MISDLDGLLGSRCFLNVANERTFTLSTQLIKPNYIIIWGKFLKKLWCIRSDEGLTLETSTFESLYGGQFTLSTQLMKPNNLIIWQVLVADITPALIG